MMASSREVKLTESLSELEETMQWDQVMQIEHETQRELIEEDLKEINDPRTMRSLHRSKRKREALIEQTAAKIVKTTEEINKTKEELEDLCSKNPERQKQYKESGRILKKALSAGTVLVQFIMCIIVGAAGAGKTCLRSLLLGEAPPTARNSTLLEVPVQIHVRKSQALVDSPSGNGRWKKTNNEDLFNIITKVVLCTEKNESIITKLTNALKSYIPFSGQSDDLTPLTRSSREQSPIFQDLPSASQRAIRKIIDQLLERITRERKNNKHSNRGKSKDDLCYKWIYFTDSGGQKPFQELLPLFVHGNSAILAVINLCDKLDEYPTIPYYKHDCLKSKQESELTTEEMIQHLIRSLKSMEAQATHTRNERSLFVVGTHKDEMKSCSESLDEKNKRLLDKEMLGRLNEHLVYVDSAMTKVVFAVNTKTPEQVDHNVAETIRKQITDCIPVNEKKIPIWWYILQLMLLELAHQLEKSVLSIDECVLIAKAFGFKAKEVEEALKFFHKLNVFHYYPHIDGLKRIVFTNSQVPLDKVSELVDHNFELRGAKVSSEQTSGSQTTATPAKWKRFRDHGIVTVDCLRDSKFSKHYVEGLFTADEFLELLQNLLAIAPLSLLSQSGQTTEYLMPCLLETLSSSELEAHCVDSELVVPTLLLIFPDGWPRLGTFCCLVVYLMKLTGWHIMNDEKDNLPKVARNLAQFDAHICKITLIDSFSYMEIHVVPLVKADSSTKHCCKKCPLIVRDILKGITAVCNALRYENVVPMLQYGFFCSHETQLGPPPSKRQRQSPPPPSSSSSSNNKHPALFLRGDGYLRCMKTSSPPYELEERHKVWNDAIPLVPKITESDVINEVGRVVDWYSLGINLQLKSNKLDEIDDDNRTVARKRVAMVNLWFRTDTHPSWSKLCAALEAMGENTIATDIKSKH